MADFEDELDDENEDGEHDSDCGHTPEEHTEMNRRMKSAEGKMEKFLADVAEDVIDDVLLAKIEKYVIKSLKKGNVTPSLTTIKALEIGFTLGMKSTMKLKGDVAQMLMGIKRVVQVREAKKPKVEIDITQSKIMPPGDVDGEAK